MKKTINVGSYRFKLNTLFVAGMLLSLTSAAQVFKPTSTSGVGYPSPTSSPTAAAANLHVNDNLISNTAYITRRSVGPGYQMEIAGWSLKPGFGGGGGFSCGYTDPGTTPITYTPAVIKTINSAVGLEVEYLEDPTGGPGGSSGTGYIVAAYYNEAFSRYECSLYDWTTPSVVNLLSTTILGYSGTYNRISIDASADGTKVAFAWSDGSSVFTAVADLNMSTSALDFSPSLVSPAITFSNPYNCSVPDVAFRHDHVTGNDYLHYVFYNANGGAGQYSEFKELFSTFYSTSSSSYTPSGFDNNPISPIVVTLWPRIDCPDVATSEIWAYVYRDSGDRIKLHYLDPSVFTPSTLVVNNGSLSGFSPTADITRFSNLSPVVAYDGTVSKWHVGWLSPAPPTGYVPFAPLYVLIDNSLSLISDPDYLLVSPPTSVTFPYSNPPLLSFATHNSSLNYLYSVYIGESTSPTAAWTMFHKLHPVSTYSTFKLAETEIDLKTAPNPFFNTIHINMPASFLDKEMNISVTDITGRSMGSFNGNGSGVNDYLDKIAAKLVPGNYILTAVTGNNAKSTFKIEKLDH